MNPGQLSDRHIFTLASRRIRSNCSTLDFSFKPVPFSQSWTTKRTLRAVRGWGQFKRLKALHVGPLQDAIPNQMQHQPILLSAIHFVRKWGSGSHLSVLIPDVSFRIERVSVRILDDSLLPSTAALSAQCPVGGCGRRMKRETRGADQGLGAQELDTQTGPGDELLCMAHQQFHCLSNCSAVQIVAAQQ